MVVTPGRDRRAELRERLGLASADRLVYFYVGRYGQDGPGLGAARPAGGSGHPLRRVPPRRRRPAGRTCTSSRPTSGPGPTSPPRPTRSVAKAGYGTVCEAMVAGTPMIYPPRTGFAEHRALDRGPATPGAAASRRRPGDFAELRLEAALDRAFALKPGPPPFPADGAAASRIASPQTADRRRRSAGRSASMPDPLGETRHPDWEDRP